MPKWTPAPKPTPKPQQPKPQQSKPEQSKPQQPDPPSDPRREQPARRFAGLVRTGRTGVLSERLQRPKRKILLGE